MVTWQRKCLFGEIVDGEMQLNDAGRVVWEVWNSLPDRYPQITLGAAVVMPDHFHEIVMIGVGVGAIHELPLHELPRPYGSTPNRFITDSASRVSQGLGWAGRPKSSGGRVTGSSSGQAPSGRRRERR